MTPEAYADLRDELLVGEAEREARTRGIAANPVSDMPQAAAENPAAPFMDWSDFFSRDRSQSDWLHEPVLARGRGHAIYAKHGTGKSLFTLWMAKEIVAAGHVVIYVDYEMSEDDLYERLTDMGCDDPEALARLRYLLLPSLAPLNTPEGAAELMRLVDDERERWPRRQLVVVIDTISRAVRGEENSNDTIQGFYRETGLALKKRGVTWLRLDHAGHEGNRARGASSKGDDVDVVWRLSATDAGVRLDRDKGRMGWVLERVVFEKVTEPLLSFRAAPVAWPAGTTETADLLARLGVPVNDSTRAAAAALKAAGHGRRHAVVVAAQKCRQRSGTTPGTTLGDEAGNRAGNQREKPLSEGAEAPPESPGTTFAGQSGTAGGVPLGTPLVPSPSADPSEGVEP